MLEAIFIHCNIFWLSFALDTEFFLTSFSTCFFKCTLPFHFIIVLVLDLGHWGIMLKISPFSKSFWKNTFPLFTSCNLLSSTIFDVRTSCGCSWTIGWGPTSTSSFEFEITIICGTSFDVEVMVVLGKFNVASNSSSNSLFLYSCSKLLISSVVGVHEKIDYIEIALVN